MGCPLGALEPKTETVDLRYCFCINSILTAIQPESKVNTSTRQEAAKRYHRIDQFHLIASINIETKWKQVSLLPKGMFFKYTVQ